MNEPTASILVFLLQDWIRTMTCIDDFVQLQPWSGLLFLESLMATLIFFLWCNLDFILLTFRDKRQQ